MTIEADVCESCDGTGAATSGIYIPRIIPCPECGGDGHTTNLEGDTDDDTTTKLSDWATYDRLVQEIVCYSCGIQAHRDSPERCIACGYDGS